MLRFYWVSFDRFKRVNLSRFKRVNLNRPYWVCLTVFSTFGEYVIDVIGIDEKYGFTGFVITTGDGYKYTFGGIPEIQRHSIRQNTSFVPYMTGAEVISTKTSWPLT